MMLSPNEVLPEPLSQESGYVQEPMIVGELQPPAPVTLPLDVFSMTRQPEVVWPG